MPTVDVEIAVIGLSPGPLDASGAWQVVTAYSHNDGKAVYQGISPAVNAQMSAGFASQLTESIEYVYERVGQDEGEVSVDIPVPPTVSPGDVLSGTVTYPDSWHGAEIHLQYVFSNPSTFISYVAQGAVWGPFIGAAPLGTVSGGAYDGQPYHATRVRETGYHEFKFIVPQSYGLHAGQLATGRTLYFDWAGASGTALVAAPTTLEQNPQVTVNHTFTGPGTAVSCYAVDGYGQRSPTLTLWLPPIAKAVLVESDSPRFYFDLSDSYDPDSAVCTFSFAGPNGDGLYWVDLTNTALTNTEPQTINLTLLASDNYTPTPLNDTVQIAVTVDPLATIAADFDKGKTLQLISGATSHRAPHGLPATAQGSIIGSFNPDLWIDGRNWFWMGAQYSGDGGNYHFWRSKDAGLTWSKVTMTEAWDNATHYGMRSCGTIGGGAASCAIRRDGSNKVDLKVTGDPTNWAGITAIEAGTVTGSKALVIRQNDKGHFVITNNNGFGRISKADGADGSWQDW